MRAMGYHTFGYKLAAFTLAGRAGGGGGLPVGAQTGFVNPELMGFHMSAHAIMMVILGGMGNFAGAVVGAFAFEYLMHLFKDLTGDFRTGKHWQLLDGRFIVLIVIFAPRGLLGLGEALQQRWWPANHRAQQTRKEAAMSEVLLGRRPDQALWRPGGGQRRVAHLHRDQHHAVIGPNGAGKSTLTNLLSGDLPPTQGRITLAGQDVTGWNPKRSRAAAWAAATRRPTSSCPSPCGKTCGWPPSRARPHVARWLSRARRSRDINERAERAIELAGLTPARTGWPAPSATASSASSRSP
jgi:hypothetical protein